MESIAHLLSQLGALPSDWHAAGCLEMPNIEALARHASARRIQHSIETGAGRTTLLLSHLSDHHVVFSVDDGESLSATRRSPLLRASATEFVDGPTQKTLFAYPFPFPLQLVLLDGPHGFPFPNLEYWALYRHIEAGGLLVVDDIHIPTIRQLFDFLREEPMFRLLEVVGKTAFFERTDAPTFDPFADNWWTQPYNTRRFPVDYSAGGLGRGTWNDDVPAYRDRLLPLVERWKQDGTRVAIFGTGPHTEHLFKVVPELDGIRLEAFLDSRAGGGGKVYRGRPVQAPDWSPGHVDLVLCSSFEHELVQLALLDGVPVKALLSHPPCLRPTPGA